MTALSEAVDASIGKGDSALAEQLVILCEIERYNLVTEAVETLRFATTEYATTVPYYVGLEVPQMTQTILEGGDWKHSTGSTFSQLRILNIEGLLDAELDFDTYDIKGRQLTLLGGLLSQDYADFEELPGGTKRVLDVLPDEDGITLLLTDLLDRPDQLVLPNKYGGFDSAYDFDGAATANCDDVFNFGRRDVTFEIRFKTGSTGGTAVMLAKRNGVTAAAGNAGYVALIDSSDQIRVYLDDGSGFVNVTVGSAAQYTDDEWHRLTVRLARSAGELYAYVDGELEEDAIDISSVSANLSNTQSHRIGSDSAGGNNFTGELDEARIWYEDLTEEQQAAIGTEFALNGYEGGLVGLYQFDERAATTSNIVQGPFTVHANLDGSKHATAGDFCDPGSGDFTAVAWFRADPGDGGTIMSRRPSSGGTDVGWSVTLSSGALELTCCDGSNEYTANLSNPGLGTLDDGTPWGVAISVDRTADTLTGYLLDYARGTMSASTAVDISAAGSFGGGSVDFLISGYADNSDRFTGSLAWIGFTDLALATNIAVGGIASQMAAALSSPWATVAGLGEPGWFGRFLVAQAASRWWPLFDNTGTVATEYMNGDDATFNSAPTWIDTDAVITSGGASGFTATLEGDRELKGTPKPICFGAAYRFSPPLVDRWGPTYQYSDPAVSATHQVNFVYAGAVELTLTTQYTADLTLNTITTDQLYDEEITMNAYGVLSSNRWLRFPGEQVQFLWEAIRGVPGGSIDSDSVDLYDELHPFDAGMFVSGSLTVEQFYDEMLAPDGFVKRTLGNKLALGTRLSPEDLEPDHELSDADIEVGTLQAISIPPPAWVMRLGIQKTTLQLSGFGSGVTVPNKTAHSRDYIWLSRVLQGVRDLYGDTIERVYRTPYANPGPTTLLLDRVADMESKAWQGWEMELTGQHWAIEIGDAVAVRRNSDGSTGLRYDVAGPEGGGGRNYLCLGHSYGQDESPRSRITLWGGYDLDPEVLCPEAPTLLQQSKIVRCYETRFEDNAASAGVDISVSGDDVTGWVDRGSDGADLTATASRNPHWTPGLFGQGEVGGVDFSVLSGSNTSCELAAAATFNPRADSDRVLMGFAVYRPVLASCWLSRPSDSYGLILGGVSGNLSVQADGAGGGGCPGSFQIVTTNGDNEVSAAESGAEPFVLIIELGESIDSNHRWHTYFGNLSLFDGELVPIHDTSSPFFLDCTGVLLDGLGSPQDTTGGRTNFHIGAFIYYDNATPNSGTGTAGDVNDPTIQALWQYLRHYYLLGCP